MHTARTVLPISPAALILAALLVLASSCLAQSPLDLPTPHGESSGNLPELLRFIAQQYQVPIVGELVYPVPSLAIAAGTNTARDVLRELIKAAPDYQFDVVGGVVVHFYSKEIKEAHGNFLNVRFRRFTMPRDVSEFKLLFPARLGAARRGYQGEGIVMSGFGQAELEKESLPQVEMEDASGRDVLLKAARATRGFYSIIVFPNLLLSSEASVDYAFQHWFWGSVRTRDERAIYIQHAPED